MLIRGTSQRHEQNRRPRWKEEPEEDQLELSFIVLRLVAVLHQICQEPFKSEHLCWCISRNCFAS